MSQYHTRTFPGETVAYRQARDELLTAEMELRQKIEDVAALRRKLPHGARIKADYVFEDIDLKSGDVRNARMSELFDAGKDSLIVYGFMYGPDWTRPCPLCTSITDGSDGIAPHVRARTNYVVVAKAEPDKLKRLAQARGWKNIRLLSSFKNTFNKDYLAEWQGDFGEHHPMLNVFVRRQDGIFHFWGSEMYFVPMKGAHPRHVDAIWPLWSFLDLTPEGRGDFLPKLEY